MSLNINPDYLAGFIDGEGHIGIYKTKKWHWVRVGLTNTNLNAMSIIQSNFGGSLKIHERKMKNRKITYSLAWNGFEAQELLKKIIDSLIIKREQACIALNFPIFKPGGQMVIMKKEDHETREEMRKKIMGLNRRGPMEEKEIFNIIN